MDKRPLFVQGMHGLGDNIHQRALLRLLMQEHSVTLESSWVSIYHDLIEQGLRVVRKPIALRTQLKNAEREAAKFARPLSQLAGPGMRISYSATDIANTPSHTIMEAMARKAGLGSRFSELDWSLPVPGAWFDNPHIRAVAEAAGYRPILVYRPLVARPEWRGSQVRNAHPGDYADILAMIRDCFFVVSVADLEAHREWIVGPRLKADWTLHKGELPFESLAALFKMAALAYTSSGFGTVLAPAVGTACITVQGGYEPSAWHTDSARFAPWLGIDTKKPCACGNSNCYSGCDKRIDLPAAKDRIEGFVERLLGFRPSQSRGAAEMFDAADPRTMAPPEPPPRRRPFIHNPHSLAPNFGTPHPGVVFRGRGVRA